MSRSSDWYNVEVIIPWGGDVCAQRRTNLSFVRDWLAIQYGYVATMGTAANQPWVKANAVNAGLEHSTAHIVIIHDADVWTDGLAAAVQAVVNGAPWAVPHDMLVRLTAESTERALAGDRLPNPPKRGDYHAPIYRGHAGGGIVVIRRDVYGDCPLDPRFEGWGQEDDSWALALGTLHGPPWRQTTALMWHLWHPPQERLDRLHGSRESHRLFNRYRIANGNPEAMRRLVDEPRVASAP